MSFDVQQTRLVLTDARLDEVRNGLEKVLRVSDYLDFPLTLDEVAGYFLPNLNLTPDELRSLLAEKEFNGIPFKIRDGYLLTRSTQSIAFRLELERSSAAKLDSAFSLARVLGRLVPFIRSLAVTGTVAYASADKWDDIDLFMITDRRRLWLSALFTLILVRLYKLLRLRSQDLLRFCLSYVHDEEGFANESVKNRGNPLFARELLKAKLVAGRRTYRCILEQNSWVGKVYASAYALKLQEVGQQEGSPNVDIAQAEAKPSLFLDWAEGLTFVFLSSYLRLRAYLNNLRLKSLGENLRVFDPVVSRSSCVYTSNFYRWLRSLWGR
jgi:hypothetical protein